MGKTDIMRAADPKRRGKHGVKAELLRTLKFVVCSCSAAIIQIGATALMVEGLGMDAAHGLYWVSYVVALILSVLWNFTLNRKFTFQSAKNVPVAMSLVFAYYLVFTPASIFWQEAWLSMPGWQNLEMVINIITVLINGVTEFLWQRLVVYRKSVDTKPLKKQASDSAANEEETAEAFGEAAAADVCAQIEATDFAPEQTKLTPSQNN